MSAVHNFRSEALHLAAVSGQLPYAFKNAVNSTLFKARAAAIRAMSVYDRPTDFTLRSPFVEKATKADGAGQLVIPTVGRGAAGALPGGKPQLAEVFGGPRRLKRSEVLLQRKGILPAGMYAVPGPAAEIDAFGNWSRRQILHLLAYFAAFGPQSRSGKRMQINTTALGRERLRAGRFTAQQRKFAGPAGVEYFVAGPGGKGLKPGVYVREFGTRRVSLLDKRRVRPVLFFVTGAQYRKRYPFHQVVGREVESVFAAELDAAVRNALASGPKPQGGSA